MPPKRVQREVERVLAKEEALDALESLIEAGCDRARVLSLLELGFWTDESWEALVGMELRDFKAVLSHIRHCADLVARLERSELIYHLGLELRIPEFEPRPEELILSAQLRRFAEALHRARKLVGPDRRDRLNAFKAHFVAIVLNETGRPCDSEVSALLAAVLHKPTYTTKAHQAWRRKHVALVARTRATRLEPSRLPPNPS